MIMTLAGALGMAGAVGAVEWAGSERAPLLRPDLVPLRPGSVSVGQEDGHDVLRFSSISANIGQGPLELRPRKDDCDRDGDSGNDRSAVQRTFRDVNGNGEFDRDVDTERRPQLVGCFVFHEIHNHWHFKNFARYAVFSMKDGLRVAVGSKIGFCVVDTIAYDTSAPGAPEVGYYDSCQPDAVQGLSVGWADLYASWLDGQSLTIDGVPPGRYCLITTFDPQDRLDEIDETNNRVALKLHIELPGIVKEIDGGCRGVPG